MRDILLIYNPNAGNGDFNGLLDFTIATFQKTGANLDIYRTRRQEDFYTFLEKDDCRRYESILVAGGDGSISLALNAMMAQNVQVPLGIIPAGTSNDFAHYLNIPMDLKEAVLKLGKMRSKWIDVGKANDRYFINVCAGGLIANVAYTVDAEAKDLWGKAAYYAWGFRQATRNKSFRLLVEVDGQPYEEDYALFLIMNGANAGGFRKLGIRASAEDGRLDFVGIRSMALIDLPRVFSKILMGEHIDDPQVRYLTGEHFEITYLSGDEGTRLTGIDGEEGPAYPLTVDVLKNRLQILY